MTASMRRGWCPSALKPMTTGDGLLMRLRAPLGKLSLAQAQGLAEAAARHGNGVIDLTSRANLQVRGLTEASHRALIDDLAGLDLLDSGPDSAMLPELPCTLIASPFAEPADLLPLRAALEAKLRGEARLEGLPPKFCIVLDEVAAPLFNDIPAHLRILFEARGGGATICGEHGAAMATAEIPERVVKRALAAVLSPHGDEKAGHAVFAAKLGEALAPNLLTSRDKSPEGSSSRSVERHRAENLLGPFRHGRRQHAGIGVSFSSMQAHCLVGLVSAMRVAGAAELRLTPWQMLIVPDIDTSAVPHLIAAASRFSFIVAGDDPRRAVSACAGKPDCASACLPVRDDAMLLAQLLGTRLHQNGVHVHLSGCEKACSRSQRANYTLWATPLGYVLLDKPPLTPIPTFDGLSLAAAAARIEAEIG